MAACSWPHPRIVFEGVAWRRSTRHNITNIVDNKQNGKGYSIEALETELIPVYRRWRLSSELTSLTPSWLSDFYWHAGAFLIRCPSCHHQWLIWLSVGRSTGRRTLRSAATNRLIVPFLLPLPTSGTHSRKTSVHQLCSHFSITWKPFCSGAHCRTLSCSGPNSNDDYLGHFKNYDWLIDWLTQGASLSP